MTSAAPAPVLIGKYRVSSLPQTLDNGRFRAGVSIRSGSGSASTDRILRFKGSFATEAAAHRYAHDQGRIWVSRTGHTA